jgi:hypothetical protein
LGKFAYEVEALPFTEFEEWCVHFAIQEEERASSKKGKSKGAQVPKKERERLARERGE